MITGRRFRAVSIRQKLTMIAMLASASALLLTCVTFVIVDLYFLRGRVFRDLDTLAQVVGSNSTAALSFRDRESATEILSALRAKPSVRTACIYTKEGTPFARYDANAGTRSPVPPMLADGPSFRNGLFEVSRAIELHHARIGTIYVAADRRSLSDAVRSYLPAAGVILVVALFLSFVIASRLQRVISVPILGLAGVAEEVSRLKDYSLRAPLTAVRAPGEVSDLVRCFNEMLAEIQRRDRGLEDEVTRRTHELKTILDAAGEGIFGIDASGLVTFINPAAAKLLGVSSEELIGRCCHDFLHASTDVASGPLEACSVCSCTLLPIMRTSRISVFLRQGHGPFPVEYTASPIVASTGRPSGVVVTFRDITERQAVDRMKSEFVSTVSHELRTPLTSIRGALGLLASGLLGNVAAKGQRMLDIAVNNTDRLVRLINDILDLERMESGRVELHRKVVDAYDLAMQATDVMKAMADRAGISLVVEIAPQALWVDADQIIQILTNLVSNAVKFSPPGATVTLSTRSDGKTLTFVVADEGRGIPTNKLETVFERFQQVDASDSRQKGGTGLGLAICRSIVNAHGGRIWAESTEGKGSVLQIALPLRITDAVQVRKTSHPSELPQADTVAGQRATILVVEDDLDLARILTTALDEHGIRVLHAANGRAAVEAVIAARPDLIVLDLGLPEMDGFAVVDCLKRDSTFCHSPLIVYSALDVDESQKERLRLGPTEYLTKSRTSLEQFEQRVMHLLQAVIHKQEVAGAA